MVQAYAPTEMTQNKKKRSEFAILSQARQREGRNKRIQQNVESLLKNLPGGT